MRRPSTRRARSFAGGESTCYNAVDGTQRSNLGKEGIRWPGIWNEEFYNLVAAEAWRFLPYLKHTEERVRLEACQTLSWFPDQAHASTPLIQELLKTGSEDQMVVAAVALGLLGEASEPILHKSPRLRYASVTAYCHVHTLTVPYFEVFSDIAGDLDYHPQDHCCEPFPFGILHFAGEVLKRQEPETVQRLLAEIPNSHLERLHLIKQPWDDDWANRNTTEF